MLVYLVVFVYLTDDVSSIMSTSTKNLVIVAKPLDTIWSIKDTIEEQIGIPPHHQQLKLEGKPLNDSYILSSSAKLTPHLKLGLCG